MEKVNHYILLSVATMVGMTTAMGMFLSTAKVSADSSAVSTASITVPVACTMTGEGTEHTATLAPNTYSGASGSEYANGIGKTTLTAMCNDDNGFSIYAIGYTGNQYEGENHTKLIGQSTNSTISTKAYASGDTTSNWSMKLTKITDPAESYNPQNLTIQSDTEGSFDTWHSIPSTYTKVAQYHANTGSSTTDTTLGVKLETTYAAYISSSQPADTYVGQVKYTMVHPYIEAPLQPQTTASGKICYYPNSSNVDGTMGCQTIPTSGTVYGVSPTSATLLASNFSRTGYGFAGWSNKFDYATNPNQEGIKFYGPQEDITFTAGEYTGSNNGLALYAVWVKSQGSIQDTTKVSEVCNRLTTAPTDGTANLSSVSAFTDSRDNNTYAIAKLADGKCWMIENLRLQNTAEHNSDGTLSQGYGGQFAGLADAEPAWANNITTDNSLYSTDGTNDTINIGTSDAGYRSPRYNNINTPTNTADRPQNPATNGATNSTSNASMYSYGNYYTWAAAIADTTSYSSGDHNTTSICPTGWQLPLGNTSTGDIEQGAADVTNKVGGFSYLDRKMGGTGRNQSTAADSLRWRKYPVNFVYSGNVSGGSVVNRGSNGNFWSSTAYSSYSAYPLNLYSSSVSPGINYGSKYYGRTVRCVAPGV